MPWPKIVAIVPASGKGTRFGGAKAEARIADQTFAERIETTLRGAGITQIHIARNLDTPDMLATLRQVIAGIKPNQAEGYLIWPVDHPLVQPSTVVALCEAWSASPDAVFRPVYQGKSGHPVLVPAWVDLGQDDLGQGLAGIIGNQVCTVVDLPVDDPGVLRNINQPSELEE